MSLPVRTRIIKSAIRNFSQKGFHRTSIEEIALASYCTVADISEIYPTKQALFLAVLHAADAERFTGLNLISNLQSEPNFEKAVICFVDGLTAVIDKPYMRLRCFAFLEQPKLMRDFFTDVSLPYYEALRNRIRRERISGRVRNNIEPESAANAVMFFVGYRKIVSHSAPIPGMKSLTRRTVTPFIRDWIRGISTNHTS